MKMIILAGQSGAGLTTALGALEDQGYETVRSLPAGMIGEFVRRCEQQRAAAAAASICLRTEAEVQAAMETIQEQKNSETGCQLIFLEAEEQTLINRYKFTRRPHPLSQGFRTTAQAIRRERELILPIRIQADCRVDTTRLNDHRLRETMARIATEAQEPVLTVSVVSFGFKYGIPADADLVFDVRFLPNPYWVPELREKNGTNEEIRNYVFHDGTAEEYMDKLYALADFLIPQYQREGKAVLTIAIGCTGGKHRSVAIAQDLYEYLRKNGILSAAIHRDWQKG